jgi:DNA-directed RNA polymerase subunit RPC12/RpoP
MKGKLMSKVVTEVGLFEPGEIRCTACDHKPEDGWSMSPEGFVEYLGEWYCDDCGQEAKSEDEAAFKAACEVERDMA